MKVPGQRSSFHICDILDLNNSADKTSQNNNNNNNSTSNNNNSTNTSFPPQTSPPTSRDGDSITNLNDSIASTGSSAAASLVQPPLPPPYQLTPNLSSAIYSELGHHYQSIFPSATATKSWLKEHEQYGKFSYISNTLNRVYDKQIRCRKHKSSDISIVLRNSDMHKSMNHKRFFILWSNNTTAAMLEKNSASLAPQIKNL